MPQCMTLNLSLKVVLYTIIVTRDMLERKGEKNGDLGIVNNDG